MKLKLLINKYINRYSQIIKIYNIWWLVITIYWKIRIFIKQQTFNLENPLEKQLAKINSFYVILNGVENTIWEILFWTLNAEEKLFDYYWWQEMWDYHINNYDSYIWEDWLEKMFPNKKEIWLACDEELDLPFTEFFVSYKEYFLLMQIYFWVYQEKELKNKLEEKDKNWEYEEIKEILKDWNWKKKYKEYSVFEKEYLSKPEVQEYLKLELMRKDISWAFEWIEIEKIYDKDWSEEKQRKYIDEINKEFGEEVVVEE